MLYKARKQSIITTEGYESSITRFCQCFQSTTSPWLFLLRKQFNSTVKVQALPFKSSIAQRLVEILVCLVFLFQSLTESLSDLLQLSLPVCFSMPLVVDAVWALWSIGAGVYDYFHTSAMEERIHTLENVLSIHQFVIAGLSAGLILLMTYILWRKH